MRRPQPNDVYLFKLIHQARTNGRLTAFTVTQMRENEYVSDIWMSDGAKAWQFTRGGSDSSPRLVPQRGGHALRSSQGGGALSLRRGGFS